MKPGASLYTVRAIAIVFAAIIVVLLGMFLFVYPAQGPSAPPVSSGASGVKGQVSLGPVCPVERIPPDPACAPKPYETDVSIFAGDASEPYRIVRTDASGNFAVQLLPGVYFLYPTGGTLFPRCTKTEITVAANAMQTVHLSCDTGIR